MYNKIDAALAFDIMFRDWKSKVYPVFEGLDTEAFAPFANALGAMEVALAEAGKAADAEFARKNPDSLISYHCSRCRSYMKWYDTVRSGRGKGFNLFMCCNEQCDGCGVIYNNRTGVLTPGDPSGLHS